MQEKSSSTHGMCSESASCIRFQLWLVYNHHHTEALEIQRAPKDLNHYLEKIQGLLVSQCVAIEWSSTSLLTGYPQGDGL